MSLSNRRSSLTHRIHSSQSNPCFLPRWHCDLVCMRLFDSSQWCVSHHKPPTACGRSVAVLSTSDHKQGPVDHHQTTAERSHQDKMVGRVNLWNPISSKGWVTPGSEGYSVHCPLPCSLWAKAVHLLFDRLHGKYFTTSLFLPWCSHGFHPYTILGQSTHTVY